jgi:TM2 domain-containing membrane protein YozV
MYISRQSGAFRMQVADPVYTANMTDHQRSWFYAEYQHASRDEVIGVLLAIFLGGFGIHHFYLRRNGTGFIYLVLSWTGVPTILGWIEAFFMPGRVRQYNAQQASYIASQILSSYPGPHCPACSRPVDPNAIFCKHCGATTTPASNFNPQPIG